MKTSSLQRYIDLRHGGAGAFVGLKFQVLYALVEYVEVFFRKDSIDYVMELIYVLKGSPWRFLIVPLDALGFAAVIQLVNKVEREDLTWDQVIADDSTVVNFNDETFVRQENNNGRWITKAEFTIQGEDNRITRKGGDEWVTFTRETPEGGTEVLLVVHVENEDTDGQVWTYFGEQHEADSAYMYYAEIDDNNDGADDGTSTEEDSGQ